MEFVFSDAKQYTGLEHCQARDEEKLNYHFNASLTSVNIAKGIARKGVKKDEEINISISDIKIELSNRLLSIYLFQTMELTQTCKKIGRFTTSSLTLEKCSNTFNKSEDWIACAFLSFGIYKELLNQNKKQEPEKYLDAIKQNYLDRIRENSLEKSIGLAVYYEKKKIYHFKKGLQTSFTV